MNYIDNAELCRISISHIYYYYYYRYYNYSSRGTAVGKGAGKHTIV